MHNIPKHKQLIVSQLGSVPQRHVQLEDLQYHEIFISGKGVALKTVTVTLIVANCSFAPVLCFEPLLWWMLRPAQKANEAKHLSWRPVVETVIFQNLSRGTPPHSFTILDPAKLIGLFFILFCLCSAPGSLSISEILPLFCHMFLTNCRWAPPRGVV